MTAIPLWLAILFPTLTLLLGAFGAAWTVYTWVRKQGGDRDAQYDAKIAQVGARMDSLGKDIAQARETSDLKLATAVEKESKSRHDAQNATSNALAALQQRFDAGMRETASREEVRQVETRLTTALSKVEMKVDQLSALVPEMNATLKSVAQQVERMASRLETRLSAD
jgi:chromosome segregation ATPase